MNKPVAWSYEKLGSMERQAMDLADELSMGCTQIGVEAARILRMLAITVYMQGEEIAKCHTHPVKEITDEEIWEVWKEAKNITLHTEGAIIEIVFAKAILRKAQEK